MMNKIAFALAVFGCLGFASAQNIGCYTPGICVNSTQLGTGLTTTSGDCHKLCEDTNLCKYFSFNSTDNYCQSLRNCTLDETDCPDCMSGDVSCPYCARTGHCIGTVIGATDTLDTWQQCSDHCYSDDDCAWWSFNEANKLCDLLLDCITDGCPTCISGERGCTPPPSTTTTTTTQGVTPAYGCGDYVINDSYGEWYSTNYPSSYPNNQDCSWQFNVAAGQTVSVEFDAFNLEYGSSSCPYDWVRLYDGPSSSSTLIDEFCGSSGSTAPSGTYTSSSNVMYATFRTDGSVTYSGFYARFFTS